MKRCNGMHSLSLKPQEHKSSVEERKMSYWGQAKLGLELDISITLCDGFPAQIIMIKRAFHSDSLSN